MGWVYGLSQQGLCRQIGWCAIFSSLIFPFISGNFMPKQGMLKYKYGPIDCKNGVNTGILTHKATIASKKPESLSNTSKKLNNFKLKGNTQERSFFCCFCRRKAQPRRSCSGLGSSNRVRGWQQHSHICNSSLVLTRQSQVCCWKPSCSPQLRVDGLGKSD